MYDRGGWRAVKEFLFERENSSPAYAKGKYFRLARLSTSLGRNDDAFDFLGKAIELRDSQILLLKYEPTFEPLRSDARYPDILAKVGFPPDN